MLTEVLDSGPVAGINVCVCVRRSLPFSLPVYCDTLNCFAKRNKKAPWRIQWIRKKLLFTFIPRCHSC